MSRIRILFSIEDFKTQLLGQELARYNCEIVPNGERLSSPIIIIVSGFFQKKRIHCFVFRYLNDNESLYESVLFLLRDFLTIIVCKILSVRIIWLMHNIDQETHQNYPILSRLRRKMVETASGKIFVTDPHLVKVAEQYGIKREKLGWTCFGTLQPQKTDLKNIELRKKIEGFREELRQLGNAQVIIGLCVSEPAKKKNHYLKADSIVGKCRDNEKCCVGLVMIGKYPEGEEFDLAKRRSLESPYIFLIEESFSVTEEFIADQVDYFYRGLTDQSVAYTLYVAAGLRKPIFVHETGALPLIVEKEKLGYVIDEKEKDIPGWIVNQLQSWNPIFSQRFLAERSWKIGAKKLIQLFDVTES